MGELEINFRYEDINWLVGTASGNTYARAGYYIGGNMSYELPQSGTFSMLDLESASNVDVPGLYRFFPYTHPFNNESLLSISPASVSLNEGNSGTATFTYTVSRSGVLTGNSSVDWSLSATGDNPVNASDFFGGVLPSGSLNFAPGETTKTISILVAGDNIVELNETFSVNLINPSSNVTIATATANGTIANDDTPPEAPILALAADTGISNNDGITNNGTVNVTGLVAGATWQYSTNGGGSWTTGTGTSFGLASGTYAIGTILVRQSDIFGNTSINGQLAAVTIDTTAPTGSLGSSATAPAYATASTNPFGISDVGFSARPAFADADADGDLDLFIGENGGNTLFFRNTANPGASAPAYAAATTNPFGISDVGYAASPAFADADGDGDLDLFIGINFGAILFFRNTATAGATAPAYAVTTNPFGIGGDGYASPAFADADADGDLDLFIGDFFGDTLFFRNTANPGATAPAYAAATTNPFGISNVANYASSAFAGYWASPAFADADRDGDLDLFIGEYCGSTLFFRNTAATPVAPVNSSTANGSYGVGAVITLTLQFSEAVHVNTTGGTPRLQLETGAIDRYAIYTGGSGTNTLSFSYTVQAGDSSADLDQVSSSALELNGGTIKDAAGNNANFSLATPGGVGSLAANAAIVIATAPPNSHLFTTVTQLEWDENLDSFIASTTYSDANFMLAEVSGNGRPFQGDKDGNLNAKTWEKVRFGDLFGEYLPMFTSSSYYYYYGAVNTGILGGWGLFLTNQNDEFYLLDIDGNCNLSPGTNIGSWDSWLPNTYYFATNVVCFVAGTQIRTPQGERAIETLQPGDLISTANGVKPVKFVSRNTRHFNELLAVGKSPIRVAASAFGAAGPSADLLMSPSHALCLEGTLIEAAALLDYAGVSRVDEWQSQQLTYFNIELEQHELIWANGALTESYFSSYRSNGFSRESWDNYDDYRALYGDGELMQELPLPRIAFSRQLPVALRTKLQVNCFDLDLADLDLFTLEQADQQRTNLNWSDELCTDLDLTNLNLSDCSRQSSNRPQPIKLHLNSQLQELSLAL